MFDYNSTFVWVWQSAIGLEDFQDAEPDILAHSTSAILEHFSEKGIRCNAALKALCKRKGLPAEVIIVAKCYPLYSFSFNLCRSFEDVQNL